MTYGGGIAWDTKEWLSALGFLDGAAGGRSMTEHGGVGLGDALRPLVPLGTLVWRELKPVLAKREAARKPRSRVPGMIEEEVEFALDRLADIRNQERWWQRVCARAGSAIVRTDFFQIEAVREWLGDRQARDAFRRLVAAGLLARERDSEAIEMAADRYSHHTGEHRAKGEHAARVVAGVVLAGLYASLDPSGRTLLAAIQAFGSYTSAAFDEIMEKVQSGERDAEVLPGRSSRSLVLPADSSDFEGRDEELQKVLEILRSGGGAALCTIDGMGGVGKSTLAIRAAHRLKDETPDGQLYLDLGGASETPLSARQAVAAVVGHFKFGRQVSEDLQADLRDAVGGKRVLLLLDNARDAAAVQPFLDGRPQRCIMVITSRERIVPAQGANLSLDLLRASDAVKLLENLLPRFREDPKKLEILAERCGYLPQALQIAAGFLRRHDNWTLDRYLQALFDDEQRLGKLRIPGLSRMDVAAVLGFSVRHLAADDPELCDRFRLLSVFAGSFDERSAEAVWQEEDDDALADGLGQLCARNMVRFDRASDRYRLHDLMRVVAQIPLRPEDAPELQAQLEQARTRHALHYLEVLLVANNLYLNRKQVEGLNLCDVEMRNIIAGQAWAAVHMEVDDRAARLAALYADAGVYIMDLRLHFSEWFRWLESWLLAVRRLADLDGETAALCTLGGAYWKVGNYRGAIDCYENALRTVESTGDMVKRAAALGGLGLAYSELGDASRPLGYFSQQLAIVREMSDERGEISALGNLVGEWLKRNEPKRAIECNMRRLELARAEKDRVEEAAALGDLGIAYRQLKKLERAIYYYEEQLSITYETGDERGQGKALGNLGNAWMLLGDCAKALECYGQRIAIAQATGDRLGEGRGFLHSAVVLNELNQRAEAIERARKALAIFDAIDAKGPLEKAEYVLTAWGVEVEQR